MTGDIYKASLTTNIVSAYLEGNELRAEDLPHLIRSVHQVLGALTAEPEAPAASVKASAAQVRKSITPDALISFEDGKSYKQLKRHLSKLGLTPATYREKWGLPADYPMVAASYSALRSAYAKQAGLGRKVAAPKVTGAGPAVKAKPEKARIKGRLKLFRKTSPDK